MKTVSFYKNYSGTYTGELICYYRDLPPIVQGKSFAEAEIKAENRWGKFIHAKDCECPKCQNK